MDAIDELVAREPTIGHNRPPTLAEELTDETEGLAARAHDMIVCADERCEIIDDESSQRAVLLIGQMKDLTGEIEVARVVRKEPFLEGGRTVDRHFHSIMLPLCGPDHKKKLEGSAGYLLARIDAYRRQKDAEIAAERLRIEEEARKQRQEAEKAAAILQQGGVSQEEFDQADLARRRAEDTAATLAAQAAATVSRPIDSGFGPKTSVKKNYTVEIDVLDVAVAHCLSIDPLGLTAYVMDVYQRQVRAGVRALPGARVIEDTKTQIRRK
jgi:hypothetical protein